MQFTEMEKDILIGLLEDVNVDYFTDEEWDALTILTAKVASM